LTVPSSLALTPAPATGAPVVVTAGHSALWSLDGPVQARPEPGAPGSLTFSVVQPKLGGTSLVIMYTV
jgi:hypothetical protein